MSIRPIRPIASGRKMTPSDAGFTLIELLVVTAIVTMLASILMPVFAQVREKSRQTSCLSNEHQLGLAILAYQQDSEEQFPNGITPTNGRPFWAGEGWASQCLPYLKDVSVLRCPDDSTPSVGPRNQTVSYGYNINLVTGEGFFQGQVPPGKSLAVLTAPAHTVVLFEVSGVTANLSEAAEGETPGGTPGRNFSASSTGLDNRLYAQTTVLTSAANQYTTGYLGGRPPAPPSQFRNPQGRHGGGSNFLMADGHTQWLRGENVSSGINALGEHCGQDNLPPVIGCSAVSEEPYLYAAGTGTSLYRATFSTE